MRLSKIGLLLLSVGSASCDQGTDSGGPALLPVTSPVTRYVYEQGRAHQFEAVSRKIRYKVNFVVPVRLQRGTDPPKPNNSCFTAGMIKVLVDDSDFKYTHYISVSGTDTGADCR